MSELLPCPFCGGHDIRVADVCSLSFACGCMDCGASAGITSSKTEAIEVWNTRADDYRQAAEYWQRMYEETVRERTCHIVEDSLKIVLSDGTELFENGCSECNSYLDDGDNYCSNCGAKVVS